MERNQLTALLLMFLLLTLYFQFFSPTEVENNTQKQAQKAVIQKNPYLEAQKTIADYHDSTKAAQALGQFAPFVKGKTQEVSLENKDVKITFSTQGARVKSVLLKNYKTFDKKPLILEDEKSSLMTFNFKTNEGKTVDIYKLFYQTEAQAIQVKAKEKGKITFTLQLADNQSIEQIYSLGDEGYQLDYDLKFKGLDKIIDTKTPAEFFWIDNLKSVDSDLEQTRYYSTINYATPQNGFNYLYWPSTDPQETTLREKISWVSFKQKFFSSAIIAKNQNFYEANLLKTTDLNRADIVKTNQANLKIAPQEILNGKGNFSFYYGPNKNDVLAKIKVDYFEKNVHLGWSLFAWFAKYLIIPIFSFLESFLSNYGLIIILMVVIVKVLLLPLSYTSYVAMAKMKVMNDILKPELDAFKEKNGLNKAATALSMEEQQKVQQEQMRLYGELGTSPLAGLSGCIPLLLQMPILFAMFMFFPNAIEFRQQSFLWAHDLSTYDSILNLPFSIPFGFGSHISLFTILMTASTLAVTYFQNQSQSNLQGPMVYMMYIMPLVLMFVLNSYPAGLNFYYLVQNVVSLGQQQFIKKFFVDEAKIRAKFEDYKKNAKNKEGKKKPTFTEKLMEIQKQQQAQIEAKKKAKEQKNQKPDINK